MRYLLLIGLLAVGLHTPVVAQTTEPGHKPPVLRMGIFPRRNARLTKQLFEPLRAALSEALHRPIELETTYDFASFWDNVSHKRYDIVHYNQYHYIKSHINFGYNVIAQNVEFGNSKMAAALVVRKDSDMQSVTDLKGKKIVFGGGRSAMIAYIATTYLLRQAGLKDGDYFEHFALNPPKAVIATYYQQAAAAGASSYILDLPQVSETVQTNELRYLAVSEPMANLPWALKQELTEEFSGKIRGLLFSLDRSAEGRRILKAARIDKFIPAEDHDYDPHRRIVKAVFGENY